MKRGKQIDTWYPMFIDKWLFGSTRHELIVKTEDGSFKDMRGIFLDLLTLSKKDKGFIRANETTPYPHEQLAGMFCAPLDDLRLTLALCIKHGKLSETEPGIYYVNSTETYSLSDRWKREKAITSENMEVPSENEEARVKDIKGENSRGEDTREALSESDIDSKFSEFWNAYPKEGRLAQDESRVEFGAICERGELPDLIAGFHGYIDFLKHQRIVEKFNQKPLYAKTFLHNRWREFIGFKYEAGL